jgi:hypothetical protein
VKNVGLWLFQVYIVARWGFDVPPDPEALLFLKVHSSMVKYIGGEN